MFQALTLNNALKYIGQHPIRFTIFEAKQDADLLISDEAQIVDLDLKGMVIAKRAAQSTNWHEVSDGKMCEFLNHRVTDSKNLMSSIIDRVRG